MKLVEFVDCEIIQDLLPSYSDKVSSNSTNNLVERHMKKCKECSLMLKNMDKDIDDVKFLKNQDEQIDFLKGYRKNKIKMIILVIILIISVIILGFVLFLSLNDFFIDVNKIKAVCSYERAERVTFYVISEQYDLSFSKYEEIDEQGDKTVYLKVVGKYPFKGIFRRYVNFDIDDSVEKICMQDKKGNLKEIWNKSEGVLTDIGDY